MPLLWVQAVLNVKGGNIYHLMVEGNWVCLHAYDDVDLIKLFMEDQVLRDLIEDDFWFLELSLLFWNCRTRYVSQEVMDMIFAACGDAEKLEESLIPELIEVQEQKEPESDEEIDDNGFWNCDGYSIPGPTCSDAVLVDTLRSETMPLISPDLLYDENESCLNQFNFEMQGDDVYPVFSKPYGEMIVREIPVEGNCMSFQMFFSFLTKKMLPLCRSWKGYQIIHAFCLNCTYNGQRDSILVEGLNVSEYSAKFIKFKDFLVDWISLWFLVMYQREKDDLDENDWIFLNNYVANFEAYYDVRKSYQFSFDKEKKGPRFAS